jgi:hypothetical protein
MGTNPGWTVETLKAHVDIVDGLRERLADERDRRISDLRQADQRALQIKETADLRADDLERENRAYKDEKANNLRSQIEGERGEYARQTDLKALEEKFSLALKPVTDYMAASRGSQFTIDRLIALVSVGALIYAALSGHLH